MQKSKEIKIIFLMWYLYGLVFILGRHYDSLMTYNASNMEYYASTMPQQVIECKQNGKVLSLHLNYQKVDSEQTLTNGKFF